MIRIVRITTDDPLYAQQVDLREAVLLGPLGLTVNAFREIAPDTEDRGEHFVAVFDHPGGDRVVASATLVPPGVDSATERFGKVQQVAVDPQRQREGIGRRLMTAIEARAFGELGLPGLYCHAQIEAVPFYQRMGWQMDDTPFLEAGIEHRRMWIQAPERPGDAEPGAGG